MSPSGDVRKLFLQAILSRGILSEKLARAIWSKCNAAVSAATDHEFPETNDAWNDFVASVNTSIDAIGLDFHLIQDEVDGKKLYGLINRNDDEIAQVATDYTPQEISYFKAVVELIMLAPREAYSVSSLAALREVSAIKPKTNMTKSQAENVLGSFVSRGWLLRSRRGRYSLSPRALLELKPYLSANYQEEVEASECTICSEMVTKGMRCNRDNCQVRLHFHCFKTYRKRNNTCPVCKENWPTEPTQAPLIPIGEDAARDGDDSRRRARRRESEVNEDEDESMEDASQSQSHTQTQPSQTQSSQSTAKGKKRVTKRSRVQDDDEESDDD